MYTRKYKLVCEGEPKMNRFRIVTTQGLSFEQLMKTYNTQIPKGFITATDDYFDNTRWEITSVWENKSDFVEAQKHPYRKMFWTRFEHEAFVHEIDLQVIDGETGEVSKPLAID
jgi:hypothetical protein